MRIGRYLITLAFYIPVQCFAHGLLLSVSSEADRIVGAASFSNGEAAPSHTVELTELDAPPAPPQTTVTDAQGRFSFTAKEGRRYRVSVYGEEGHETQKELTAGEGASAQAAESCTVSKSPREWPLSVWVLGTIVVLLVISFVRPNRQP